MFKHHGRKLARGCGWPLLLLFAGCSTTPPPPAPPPLPPAPVLQISPAPPEVKAAAADLRDRRARLQAWATGRAMTTLAANAPTIDPKFAGAKATLERLGRLDPNQPFDVPALTFRDPDYWRGVMEMAPGNLLVAGIPVVLFAANGELDQAQRLAVIIKPFSQEGTLAAGLLDEFATREKAYREALNRQIRRGIALHDQGRYAEAIAVYRELLAACPDSAWARYELFFSTHMSGGARAMLDDVKTGGTLWSAAAPEIYRMDPLYPAQYSGQRGRTMGSLLDRFALRMLFEKPPAQSWEVYDTYADLALKLEAYGYAAHLYWFSLGLKSETVPTDEKLTRFLYCLEKLGVPGIRAWFKDDYTGAFAQLDKTLAAHRQQ